MKYRNGQNKGCITESHQEHSGATGFGKEGQAMFVYSPNLDMLQMPTILASRCVGHDRLSRRDFLAIMNHLHFVTRFTLPLHKCSDQIDSGSSNNIIIHAWAAVSIEELGEIHK